MREQGETDRGKKREARRAEENARTGGGSEKMGNGVSDAGTGRRHGHGLPYAAGSA